MTHKTDGVIADLHCRLQRIENLKVDIHLMVKDEEIGQVVCCFVDVK